MRKLSVLLALCALPAFLTGCKDKEARNWIREVRDVVKAESVDRFNFDATLNNAICNLDRTVAAGGLPMQHPSWAVCPPGGPDPTPPPDPIPDPWGDEWGPREGD